MDDSSEANKAAFVIDLLVDATENDRNLNTQNEKSCTSDVSKKEFQNCLLKSKLQSGTKEDSYSCDKYKVQFYNRNRLKKYYRTQAKEKLYSCHICKKEFSQLLIVNHLRSHAKEKPYSCDICRKQFSKKSSFIIHLHSQINENRYSCDICNKKFSQKYYLNEHRHTHTNKKPYSCDVCLKQFFQKHSLNSHLRTHSNLKLHSCDFCKKEFHQKSDLKKHYQTHTNEKPYSCDVCNKGFSQQTYLNEHYRMHTNEKPFSCDVCGKDFSWRASFRVHLRTHMTVKPFSCDVCNKTFSQRCHLNRHFRTCRGKEDANSHRQFVIDVIQLYKELPCLWKVADPDYHDKKKRGRAMKQLIDLFKTKDKNANKNKVHRKITSMRGNYKKQSNKVKASLKSGTNVNRVHIPKLWYYNLLTFLEDQNVEGTMESVLDNLPFGFNEDCEEDFNESASMPSASNSAAILQNSSQVQTIPRFKRHRPKADQVLKTISRRLNQPLEKQPAMQRKNKYDTFGGSVAERLRSLHPNMAIYCQKLITEAIFLAETGKLNISSKIVTTMNCVT